MEKWFAMIEKHRQKMQDVLDFMWKNPETGYREWKANAYLKEAYEKLGYQPVMAGDIPGFYMDLDTGRPGPKILILGELDSLICLEHPDADPETGAVHACGHCAQSAALLGLAAALKEPGALDGLSGSIRLCVVPAEELIETGFREELRKKGIIHYFGGKVEFLYRGYFDGCDLAFMIHTSSGKPGTFVVHRGSNGCMVKNITYHGKAAHAGGAPHLGVNALYAANLGLSAINALRETFRDDDHIRVHPILTAGGVAVNAIPDTVKLESYVRGASMEAIAEANVRVNRALAGSAAAMGANVTLCDRPGYAPLINDETLNELMTDAMRTVVPAENVEVNDHWTTGCTDMGDLSAVMPAIHPHCSGASGVGHGADYRISDFESACMNSAKAQLALVRILLENEAKKAKLVVKNAHPRYESFEAYFKAMDEVTLDVEAVEYHGRTASISF